MLDVWQDSLPFCLEENSCLSLLTIVKERPIGFLYFLDESNNHV